MYVNKLIVRYPALSDSEKGKMGERMERFGVESGLSGSQHRMEKLIAFALIMLEENLPVRAERIIRRLVSISNYFERLSALPDTDFTEAAAFAAAWG